jgi:hypothetical protein
MMPMHSLILIHRGDVYKDDFLEIVSRIQRIAPDISTILRSYQNADLLPDAVWSQPTLIVSFHTHYRLVPKRGRIYCAFGIEKQVQAELFEKTGVPTPKTALFSFGKRLDEASWGELIVLKPVHVNSSGVGVHLVRTARLHKLERRDFPAVHPIHSDRYIVQSFIDTGECPYHYRALTMFGETLSLRKNIRVARRPPLTADDETLFKAVIASNAVAVPWETSRELISDPEIMAFAKRMHQALPGIPVLGCDILRDVHSGKLYALEANPGGNSWIFSSPAGQAARAIFGKQGMIDQFGAWDIAARALVKKTREEAL